MKLIVEPEVTKTGEIKDTISTYQPNDKVKARFRDIMSDFQVAESTMNNTYEEFGSGSDNQSRTLQEYQNDLQKRFNNNIPSPSDDPNQSWRANTIRPMTRNKVISIAAHVTQSVLYPTVIAQNEESEEDKGMAQVMNDCIEWACEQSKYEDMFVSAIIDMCVNPAIILYQDYCQVKRKIKEITKDGWEYKDIVDEVYSGFKNSIVPTDELYIGNIYEPEIQKQPFLIWKRVADYSTVKAKYGELENFKYVTAGLKTFFNSSDNTFYDQYDDNLQERLCEEVIYYNRSADLELRIVNGVLMDDVDRPLQRKDKKYPFAKSFYEQFNSRFFYGMSLVAKIMPDQNVIDTLYNMIIDGSYAQIWPSYAVYGVESMDSSVFMPGTTTAFKDPNSKVEAIGGNQNLTAGMNVLQKVESSASESSQDPLQAGQNMSGDKTKYEVVRLEQNAKTVLGLAGKMVAKLVRDFGELVVGSIVQYLPIAEVSEVVGDDVRLKFPKLILNNKSVGGSTKTKQIEFTTEMPESEEEEEAMKYEMLEKEGYDMNDKNASKLSITKVNPEAFRRMKYLCKIEPDFTDRATKFYKKVQLYDRAIGNPLANQEAIFRDLLLGSFVPGQEDKYIAKQGQNQILNEIKKPAPMPTAQEQI